MNDVGEMIDLGKAMVEKELRCFARTKVRMGSEVEFQKATQAALSGQRAQLELIKRLMERCDRLEAATTPPFKNGGARIRRDFVIRYLREYCINAASRLPGFDGFDLASVQDFDVSLQVRGDQLIAVSARAVFGSEDSDG